MTYKEGRNMEQIGDVYKVNDDNTAVVLITRTSACGENCASCPGGCKNTRSFFTVKNTIGAKAGDKVKIYMPDGLFLGLSFLAYILPVILTIAVCVIVDYFYYNNIYTSAFGLFTLLFVFFIMRLFDKKIKNKASCEIIKIIKSGKKDE